MEKLKFQPFFISARRSLVGRHAWHFWEPPKICLPKGDKRKHFQANKKQISILQIKNIFAKSVTQKISPWCVLRYDKKAAHNVGQYLNLILFLNTTLMMPRALFWQWQCYTTLDFQHLKHITWDVTGLESGLSKKTFCEERLLFCLQDL